MSTARREHLNWLSQHYGFLVIEDDPYRELYYSTTPPNAHAGDPELAVQLRSASKMLAPGSRIGVLSGPEFRVQRDLSKHVRLSFATGTPDELTEVAARMKPAVGVRD
jgi:DNA-binding transcriptional MocR family regulator